MSNERNLRSSRGQELLENNYDNNSAEENKPPRPLPRPRKQTIAENNVPLSTSTSESGTSKSSHLHVSESPKPFATISKFEKLGFKHNHANKYQNDKKTTPFTNEDTSLEDVRLQQESESGDMYDTTSTLPMRQSIRPTFDRSTSAPMGVDSIALTNFDRKTIYSMHNMALYADEKYVDLYNLHLKKPEEVVSDEVTERYKRVYCQLYSAEKHYNVDLQNITKIYRENVSIYSVETLNKIFGNITGLLNFHRKFIDGFKNCLNLQGLGKFIMDMEKEYDVYIHDKWLKSKVCAGDVQKNEIFLPHHNWAANHLVQFDFLLKQMREYRNPAILLASFIINEIIEQCTAVDWLCQIEDFDEISKAGKFMLKDTFTIKDNGKNKGMQEVVFMEKYILCLNTIQGIKKCFLSFELSQITFSKKDSQTLLLSLVGSNKFTALKSKDKKIIDIWLNRYLRQSFFIMKEVNKKK